MKRFWEIDFTRAVAVLLMIAYHAAFDISYFKCGVYLGGVARYLAFPIAGTFMFLFGISMVISYERSKKVLKGINLHVKYLKRSAKLLFYAMTITLITYLTFPEEFIFFGILHFFAVSVLIVYASLMFIKKDSIYIILSLLSFITGMLFRDMEAPQFLSFLGFTPHVNTFDFFPIFPWISVVFMGVFFGKRFYGDGKRHFHI